MSHRRWIGGAVTVLLKFYWEGKTDDLVGDEVLATWMDDLEFFPRDVIQNAIRHWRRNETKRPTPADLIKLCQRFTPKPEPVPQIPVARGISPEQAETNRKIAEEYLNGALRRMVIKSSPEPF